MSVKAVKEQLQTLREELNQAAESEKLYVNVPVHMSDEAVKSWLEERVGPYWFRHELWIFNCRDLETPELARRAPGGHSGIFIRHPTGVDAEVIDQL